MVGVNEWVVRSTSVDGAVFYWPKSDRVPSDAVPVPIKDAQKFPSRALAELAVILGNKIFSNVGISKGRPIEVVERVVARHGWKAVKL